ncbi:DUF2169 family type VI secretion system accessory protein [Pantoea rwandensis]|uniref:DUF2169 domain-containing protein n=1 Tax=Pantoea rwandensis TaxID=1076550 RepID=A0A1X1CMF7_9GAMM|nr:pentapeptide repeat-containing protein [Pantoea rwandensis]ORM65547.1 hypothetical protein HA51_25145 [Pantoea rwandensis]
MNIIKPHQLALISRPYRWQQQDYLGIATVALLDMTAQPQLRDEQTLWRRVSDEMQSPDGVLDLAIPKRCAEFLASGRGYALPGASQCDVVIEVERLRKQQRLAHHQAAPFHAIAFDHPMRRALMGQNYDDRWMQHDYPGFARDTDWRVFNQAPADQWFEEATTLPRAAAWRIEHMHPDQLVQQGQLPLWQARSFITRQRQDSLLFEEVPMRATTLHFLPHCNELMLVWHGSCAINEDDAADVKSLMVALEREPAPRTVEHYRHVHQLRTDHVDAALHALRDGDLVDVPILTTGAINRDPGPWLHNLARYANRHQPQSTLSDFPIEEDIAAQLTRHEAEGEQHYQQMMARHEQESRRSKAADLSLPDGAAAYRQQRDELNANRHLLGPRDSDIARSESALLESYRLTAAQQKSAPRLSLIESEAVRQQLMHCMANSKDARGWDLTGADLSGLDLRGIDLENALLENADLSHCQLEGADLRGAILVRAECHHSRFTHCLFEGANLAQAQCWHADFSDSSLNDVELGEIQLEHCRFDRALLRQLFVQQATIAHCHFPHALLDRCDWMDLRLESLVFTHAQFSQCNLIRCALHAVTFSHAQAQGLALVTCQSQDLCFDDARLKKCMFTAESQLPHAHFRRATLTECNLRDINLQAACFDEATLENSDLSGADCRHARLRLLRTRFSRFVRTDFRAAQLNGSCLLGADLQKSQLEGCDLSDCNLFRADVSQTVTDSTTCFDHALTDSMKTLPRRREHQV